jgi:hypothetical protein
MEMFDKKLRIVSAIKDVKNMGCRNWKMYPEIKTMGC